MGDWSPIFKEIFTAVKAIFISNPQEVYTKFTGGSAYSYKTQRGLEEAITNIGNEIHNQYSRPIYRIIQRTRDITRSRCGFSNPD